MIIEIVLYILDSFKRKDIERRKINGIRVKWTKRKDMNGKCEQSEEQIETLKKNNDLYMKN